MQSPKKRKRSILIRLSIWLAVIAISLQLPMPAMVLCFGDDGHLSLEYSKNGICSDVCDIVPNQKQIFLTSNTHTQEHCGDCLDISIPSLDSTENIYLRHTSTSSADLLPAFHKSKFEFVSHSFVKKSLPTICLSSAQLSLRSLHSVVLVI